MADFLKRDRPIILLDTDGPTADLQTAWLWLHNKATGDNIKNEDVIAWNMAQFVGKGIEPNSIYDQLKRHDLYDYVEPTEGALEGVKALREMGHVVFLTSSTPETGEAKLAWLKRHGFLLQPGHRSTPEVITAYNKQLVYGNVFIDDRAENLTEHWFASGVLFSMPHNIADRKLVTIFHRYKVANGWSEVVKEVESVLTVKALYC